MAAPYLNEIRLGQPLKDEIKDIIWDVSNTFDVHGAVRSRPVPHITLFGPYNTTHGKEAKRRTQNVLGQYEVVGYEIDGFGHFGNEVIYVDVKPSKALRSLRRDLSRALRPISSTYQSYDSNRYYDFHITVAFRDIQHRFDEIWAYVTNEYDPQETAYAKRVTALRRRDMMWEWDLPRGVELDTREATSSESWTATESVLEELLDGREQDVSTRQPVLKRVLDKLSL